MCIHSKDRPFAVPTKDDMDARVIDLGGISSPENSTCMGNKMGKVVSVCSKVNQTG